MWCGGHTQKRLPGTVGRVKGGEGVRRQHSGFRGLRAQAGRQAAQRGAGREQPVDLPATRYSGRAQRELGEQGSGHGAPGLGLQGEPRKQKPRVRLRFWKCVGGKFHPENRQTVHLE